MSAPRLRKVVSISLDGKNLSLSQLRGSIYQGVEFVSLDVIQYQLYNTRLVIKKEDGENRVCLYNRLDLAEMLDNTAPIPPDRFLDYLDYLNSRGYDFTEDDLELVNGVLKAKPDSLGYFGQVGEEVIVIVGGPFLLKEDSSGYILSDDMNRFLTEED